MQYDKITKWVQDVSEQAGLTASQSGLNYASSDKGTIGVFIDPNIATLNEYIDGSAEKACYITVRYYQQYAADETSSGLTINNRAISRVRSVMDLIRDIELNGSTPGYPPMSEGESINYIENLDNDPTLEEIDEKEKTACYSFQFRIVYLQNA